MDQSPRSGFEWPLGFGCARGGSPCLGGSVERLLHRRWTRSPVDIATIAITLESERIAVGWSDALRQPLDGEIAEAW